MDPDEYDRLMGISLVQTPEMDGLGDRNVTDTEENEQGVANDSSVSTPIVSGLGNRPGADLESRGYGNASLAECLDRLGGVPSLAAPAACASEGREGYYRSQPNPRHVMSLISSQTLPQDPFHM